MDPKTHNSEQIEVAAVAAETIPAASSSNIHKRNPLVSACLLVRYVQRSVVKFVELFISNTSESCLINRLPCNQPLMFYVAGTVEIPQINGEVV